MKKIKKNKQTNKTSQKRKEELIVLKVIWPAGMACFSEKHQWDAGTKNATKKFSLVSPVPWFSIIPAACVCSVLLQSVLGKGNNPATKKVFSITKNG